MFTVFCRPTHVLPQRLDMPTLEDPMGGGAKAVRRRWPRALSTWELVVPGHQEALEQLMGLIEYTQGDTPIWFDGAGFAEVTDPILIGIGDDTTFQFQLPHRYVLLASMVVYWGGNQIDAQYWTPVGGDGITCDAIQIGPPPVGIAITAKYRRKVKCLVYNQDKPERSRNFRDPNSPSDSRHDIKLTLIEYAN